MLGPAVANEQPRSFGGRILDDPARVLDHNAWDNVMWEDDHIKHAMERERFHRNNPVPRALKDEYGDPHAADHWNVFYEQHQEYFFKDRNWLYREFPELVAATLQSAGSITICDIGAAVGNTIFPLLAQNKNDELRIIALDYSRKAISILRDQPNFNGNVVQTHVWDMADSEGPPAAVCHESVDICVLIFAFSAISPQQWAQAVNNIKSMLKPGGLLLIRDYGRWDLTQLRFKSGRLLEENFYIRGDGTRVYFFDNAELSEIFREFNILQNDVDRRLLVNRKLGTKMYRSWIQLKAKKPALACDTAPPTAQFSSSSSETDRTTT
ncbi:hypothetical protein PYCC9005_000260 [Savitreella phatthalungensis]